MIIPHVIHLNLQHVGFLVDRHTIHIDLYDVTQTPNHSSLSKAKRARGLSHQSKIMGKGKRYICRSWQVI